MQKLFNISIYLYFATYLLPFVDGLLGYELEFLMWDRMLNEEIPDPELATLWSFRWLVNVMVLGLWWLRTKEVQQWILLYTDKALLDKLLLVLVIILVLYPFLFESFLWEWGGLLWAIAAISIVFSYQVLKSPKFEEQYFSLEEHLVELIEEEKK